MTPQTAFALHEARRDTTPHHMAKARKLVRRDLRTYTDARTTYRTHPARVRNSTYGYNYPAVGDTYEISALLDAVLDAREWWHVARKKISKLNTLKDSLQAKGEA